MLFFSRHVSGPLSKKEKPLAATLHAECPFQLFLVSFVSFSIRDRMSLELKKSLTKRFDDMSSVRNRKTSKELLSESNLGPGAYEYPLIRKDACNFSFSKAIKPCNQLIKSRAPCVGEYSIPRFEYNDSNLTLRSNPKIVSSFKSSGRSKALGHDASYYQTCHDETWSSNLGPGLYGLPSTFQASLSPSSSSFTSSFADNRESSAGRDYLCRCGENRVRNMPQKTSDKPETFLSKMNHEKLRRHDPEVDLVRNLPKI